MDRLDQLKNTYEQGPKNGHPWPSLEGPRFGLLQKNIDVGVQHLAPLIPLKKCTTWVR